VLSVKQGIAAAHSLLLNYVPERMALDNTTSGK